MNIPVSIDAAGFIPVYAHKHDSGADIRAANHEKIVIYPGERRKIPTGIRVAVPAGYEMQIRSRSGLALSGIVVANSPGTVDAGYRGEIGVILANMGDIPYAVNRGDKIAQAVICPVIRAKFECVDVLDETERGQGGFGSSGL